MRGRSAFLSQEWRDLGTSPGHENARRRRMSQTGAWKQRCHPGHLRGYYQHYRSRLPLDLNTYYMVYFWSTEYHLQSTVYWKSTSAWGQRDVMTFSCLSQKEGVGLIRPLVWPEGTYMYRVRGYVRVFALHSGYSVPAPKLRISPDFPHSATPPCLGQSIFH